MAEPAAEPVAEVAEDDTANNNGTDGQSASSYEGSIVSLQSALEAARRLEKCRIGNVKPTDADLATANEMGVDLQSIELGRHTVLRCVPQ